MQVNYEENNQKLNPVSLIPFLNTPRIVVTQVFRTGAQANLLGLGFLGQRNLGASSFHMFGFL